MAFTLFGENKFGGGGGGLVAIGSYLTPSKGIRTFNFQSFESPLRFIRPFLS